MTFTNQQGVCKRSFAEVAGLLDGGLEQAPPSWSSLRQACCVAVWKAFYRDPGEELSRFRALYEADWGVRAGFLAIEDARQRGDQLSKLVRPLYARQDGLSGIQWREELYHALAAVALIAGRLQDRSGMAVVAAASRWVGEADG